MDLLLILTYTAICIVVFKIFKIPLNKWSIPTAVLGGIILIGGLVVLMNYNHPYSEITRKYFVSTPVLPDVRGRVLTVDVQPNELVKKGDVLFSIDPIPFQYKVDGLTAKLSAAKKDLKRATQLYKKQVGSKRDVDVMLSRVDELRAKLYEAEYDLKRTKVRATSAGFVTQNFVFPGFMALPVPLRPAMTFVQSNSFNFVGWYRQNSSLRLKKGFDAEIAFDAIPGKVFTAKVDKVLPVIGEGELQADGRLIKLGVLGIIPGRIPVVFKINDPRFAQFAAQIPGGAYGQSAIYSDSFTHVAIMRRILLRMSSWMSYFFPFH
ncbi:MAG: HlyD family secretion protein [Psychromonas sp.]|nr:HlyD family secretion protein [Psychromonas sp.]